MVRIQVTPQRRVVCVASIRVPVGASAAWGQMRDFRRFITLDPFHARVVLEGTRPAVGVHFDLVHRCGFLQLTRRGRIVRWREGSGYTFSDLSRRGLRHGFPHIYAYRIEPIDEAASRITITVSGRWTAQWIPRGVVHAWLYGIMWWAARAVRTEFVAYRLALTSCYR